MSSQGFGNSKPGSRTADVSEVIRNMRIMAQVAADRTYSNNPKRNFNRTSASILATYAAPSSVTGLNYIMDPVLSVPPLPIQSCEGGGVTDSALFTGTTTSSLTIADDIDLRMEGEDFTIEWFQYMTTGGGRFSRPFSKGSYGVGSGADIAVSYEGPTLYVWINGSGRSVGTVPALNTWTHIALVRQGNTLRVYKDGTVLATTINLAGKTFVGTADLTIGNETVKNANATFKGNITSFRWTKGTAVYTSNFTVPTSSLYALPNTKLLIQGITDQGCLNKTVNAVGVTVSTSTPFV